MCHTPAEGRLLSGRKQLAGGEEVAAGCDKDLEVVEAVYTYVTTTISYDYDKAETGHLILSTLHTIGAANTIDRIIDAFPAEQQRQIAIQLSLVIRGVVSQQLVPSVDGKMVPAFEIMTVTPAIRNMIRENKVPQIDGIVYSSDTPEMVSMDNSLYRLVKEGKITAQTALAYAVNGEMLARKLGVRAL